ncbi:MAG: protein kinase, partial [Planctomycetes bacterium]|nr:protein kinase [Planctomycetota bacterium]
MTFGRFQVLGELARGGMGVVYRGVDPEDGAPVAIKVVRQDRGGGPERLKRFEREVAALLQVRHPGVVRLRSGGVGPSGPWVATDLVEGETLAARLRTGGPLDPPAAAALVRDLARAVAHLHARALLHRDLKPDNVVVRPDGRPVLIDLGLVGHTDDPAAGADERPDAGPAPGRTRLTATGAVLGTPGWWAPEQAFGQRGDVGPAADVFGLGAVLYGCLTGRAPLAGRDLLEVINATAQGLVTPPRILRPGLPRALEAICLRALALAPDERHPSAEALAADLEAWLAGGDAPGGRALRAALAGAVVLSVIAGAGALVAALRAASAPPKAVDAPDVVAAPEVVEASAAPREDDAPPGPLEAPISALARLDGPLRLTHVLGDEASSLLVRASRVHWLEEGGDVLATTFGWVGARFDGATGRERAAFAQPAAMFDSAVGDGGRRLLTGASDGQARLWAVGPVDLAVVTTFVHPAPVRAVDLAPSGRVVVTATTDDVLRAWDVQRPDAPLAATPLAAAPLDLRTSPDGLQVVVSYEPTDTGEQRPPEVFDLLTLERVAALEASPPPLRARFAGDDAIVAVARDGAVLRFPRRGGAPAVVSRLPPGPLNLEVTPDGAHAAVLVGALGAVDTHLWRVDLRAGAAARLGPAPLNEVLAISADGRHVLTSGWSCQVHAFGPDGPKARPDRHQAPVAALSAADDEVVSVDRSGRALA